MFLALGYANIPNGMMVCWYIGILVYREVMSKRMEAHVLNCLNIHPASFVRCGIFITFVSRMSNLVLTITQETKINGKNDIEARCCRTVGLQSSNSH